MIANGQNGIVNKQELTAEELTQIEQLADICNHHDGIELKLNWEQLGTRSVWETNDFLYVQDGQIIGFLGLSLPNPREIEVSGMMHPQFRRQGFFRHLFEEAAIEIRNRRVPRVIFSINHVAPSGRSFAEAVGALYSFTEFEMALGTATPFEKGHPGLHVEYATTDDGEFFAECTFICFDVPPEESRETFIELMTSINRQLYIVRLEGQPIGMVHAVFGGKAVKMHGLGILPEHRRQGYGGQAFAEAVHKLLGDGHPHIEFKLRCQDEAELGIYQACGFAVTSAFDYYEVALPPAGGKGEHA